MKTVLPGLNDCKLSPDKRQSFDVDFKLVMKDVNLQKFDKDNQVLKEYKDQCGVYFWLMRLDGCEFKIYAGKTRSLAKRFRDYQNEFQPHSPNDYKLRLFQEFIRKENPEAEFDLYFHAEINHTNKEKIIIEEYRPLINTPPKPTPGIKEAKRLLHKAFSDYYSAIFQAKVN